MLAPYWETVRSELALRRIFVESIQLLLLRIFDLLLSSEYISDLEIYVVRLKFLIDLLFELLVDVRLRHYHRFLNFLKF